MSIFPQLTPSGIRFFVKKIANSKKEVQVAIIDDTIQSYESGYFKFFNPIVGTENSEDDIAIVNVFQSLKQTSNWAIQSSQYELVISVGQGKYIPILNTLFVEDQSKDPYDMNSYHMVFKTNEALPATIKKNQTINESIKERLYIAQQSLTEEMLDILEDQPRDTEVGGIPVDSEYIIFVIDNSGSMTVPTAIPAIARFI